MILSWTYCRLRQGAVGAPYPAVSVPWPETQARLAGAACATPTPKATTAAAIRTGLLIDVPPVIAGAGHRRDPCDRRFCCFAVTRDVGGVMARQAATSIAAAPGRIEHPASGCIQRA